MGADAGVADAYAQIAELYDLEHATYEDDVDCYLNFIVAAGDPVLELGCGTGRLLTAMAAAGYRVTGVDRSAAMLDRAAQAAAAAGLSDLITLHQGEMTAADRAPGGPFGVAILALDALLHVADASAQRAVLQSVRRALDPRGQVLIDVLNPTPEVLRSLDQTLSHEGTWHKPDGTRVDKFTTRRVSPAQQTISTELWYDLTAPDGSLRRIATSFPLRYLYRAELELMLELAGFAEWQVYGSYELEPFTDTSDRLIVAAEVTPSRSRTVPASRFAPRD